MLQVGSDCPFGSGEIRLYPSDRGQSVSQLANFVKERITSKASREGKQSVVVKWKGTLFNMNAINMHVLGGRQ